MGYLLIDSTASGEGKFETDTCHCRHCQAVIDKRKWREDQGIWYCSKCAGPVCHACTKLAAANNYTCRPWEKLIDDMYKQAQQRAKLIGLK